jgi:hypothetical protein
MGEAPDAAPALATSGPCPVEFGLWRSLVAHLTGGQGVAGSNPVSPTDTVLVWLGRRRPSAYVVYRNALLISGVVGMLIVALYPVAPPRLMDLGFVDTVTLNTEAYRVLQPPAFTNPYAAMPSFHVGWDLLVGIALVREGRSAWVRAVGRLIPVLMITAVVLTGNHYFLDAIAGDLIVLVSLALSRGAGQPGRRGRDVPRRSYLRRW